MRRIIQNNESSDQIDKIILKKWWKSKFQIKQIRSWQKIQFKSTEKAFVSMLTYWLEKGAGSMSMASKSTNRD